MNKQTAVQWLQERLLLSSSDELKCLNGFFVIAKEMEKEQHEMAFNEALDEYSYRSFEEYYNETFKKEK